MKTQFSYHNIISEISPFFRKHSVKPVPLCIINTMLHILRIQLGNKSTLYTYSNNCIQSDVNNDDSKTTINLLFGIMPQLWLFHAFNMVFN